MYSGTSAPETEQALQRETEPVQNNAQPKPKSEGPGRLLQAFMHSLKMNMKCINITLIKLESLCDPWIT
jgi:hypothetical protein